MQVHPTRAAVDLGLAAIAVTAAGVVFTQPAATAWGGALLVGLAIARSVTLVGVARVRAAGFEMLWRHESQRVRVARGRTVELEAEVRNRDSRAARFVKLRAVASPNLAISVHPSSGEVPAGGRLRVSVRVTAPRVGLHGLHSLSLEVRGGPGLFEVPLTFANPFGVEVLPSPYAALAGTARGGRSRTTIDAGKPGLIPGDGMELREIRELLPGDPFKRIAWKASAHRGRLLVRDYEQEERDVVWLVVDASVELWAGAPGRAPLDLAIDEAAAVAHAHLGRGDRVGLAVVASRVLEWLPPGRGPAHGAKLMNALATAAASLDADRSDLDEADVALRVCEHMRPFDPSGAGRLHPQDVDSIARHAERLLRRAPFTVRAEAPTARERLLRSYLGGFGIAAPPRLEPERLRTDLALRRVLDDLGAQRPRPSLVFLWSPMPEPSAALTLEEPLQRCARRRIEVRWVRLRVERSLPRDAGHLSPAVADAVSWRYRAAERRGERALRRLGVRFDHLRSRAGLASRQLEGPPAPETR